MGLIYPNDKLLKSERARIRGRVILECAGKTFEAHNLLCSGYRLLHARWLADIKPFDARAIGIGLSDVEPTHTDTELHNEVFRRSISLKTIRDNYIARLSASISPIEPPAPTALSIREIGLFDGRIIAVENYSMENWTNTTLDNWALEPATASYSQALVKYHDTYSVQVTAHGTEKTKLYQDLANPIDYADQEVQF